MYVSYDNAPNEKEILKRIENCRLTGGKVLDLSRLCMTELPEQVKGFEGLTELDVSYNQLQALPDWIGTLPSLKKLNLRGHNIDALPDSTGELKGLTFLDIGLNSFSEIPECVKEFSSLEHLDLEYLQRFDPEYRRTETTSDWIGNFSKLEFLNLRHCGIKSLPESMKNLSNLRTLYLGANKLSTLPEWLGDFRENKTRRS